MINLKQRISLLFTIFFFLFFSQEAFALGGSFFKKIFKEILESGVTSGSKNIKHGIKESGDSGLEFIVNPAWGRIGVRTYQNYCNKSENKNTSFCRNPDNYCNQKKYSNYHICLQSTKELKNKKTKKQKSGGIPPILVIIIIGIFVYFIFIKPKNSENKSSSRKDQNQWSANFKSDIYEDVVENRLKKLKKLLDNNVISKDEYEEQRKKIIEGI